MNNESNDANPNVDFIAPGEGENTNNENTSSNDDQVLTLDDVVAAPVEFVSPEDTEPQVAAADTSAADEKAAADKAEAEKKAADEKAAADKAEAEKKAAADKAAADEKAAADKAEAEKKAAAEKAAADSKPGFESLGLDENVQRAVKKVGYETPSPIQAETIPTLMEGRDVVGLAQTGTGKTAAFALPILSRIDRTQRTPQALVLAPTRELALQVADAFQEFADHIGGVNVLPIYGGQSYGVQLSGLRRGAHIVVGTPGRVIDHLKRGSLDISHLRYLVLDEADEMLNMGFQEDVERILADTPDEKQVALFSATMPNAIRRISQQYLNNPAEITVKSETKTASNITQRYLLVAHRNKLDALTRILEVTEFDAMIMFARTKQNTEELAEKLRARGFSAAAINGDMAQNQRERTVDQLRDGRLDILVATDVAARGLDVERISHVVNFDIPHDNESYVHRIGRTGRAGRSGEAILFVTPRERRLLKSIEKTTKSKIAEMELPSVSEVNDMRKSKFADQITKSLEDDSQIELFRALVKSYETEHDVPMVDIAAALAVQAHADEEFLISESSLDRQMSEDRGERGGRNDRGDRGGERGGRPDNRSLSERFSKKAPTFADRNGREMAVYKVAVGKRQRVRPGAIVGAIANEGGLNSDDFGKISIFSEHSLVELPADLPMDVFKALENTRVSGQLLHIEPDPGAPAGRPASSRHRDDRGSGRGGSGFGGGRGRGGDRDRDDRGGRGGYGGGRDRDDRGGRDRDDRGKRSFGGGGRDRDDRGGRGGYGGGDRSERSGGGSRGGFRSSSRGRH